MRTWLAGYEMRRVVTLDDALRVLADAPRAWTPFAGGTDLMVLLEAGRLPNQRFLNLWNLDELRGIAVTDMSVRLGALTTYSDVLAHPVLHAEFTLLGEAARETGAIAIQNRGTIGGNIANASPAADTPPALLVYDAVIHVASVRGRRAIPYAAFHTGYKTMDLAADELITAVELPRRPAGWVEAYRKVGTRRAQAISKVCFAAALDVDPESRRVREARVAVGSVAPTVLRCVATEATVRGRSIDDQTIAAARTALAAEIAPIDDIRSTARYRRLVAGNLLEAFLRDHMK